MGFHIFNIADLAKAIPTYFSKSVCSVYSLSGQTKTQTFVPEQCVLLPHMLRQHSTDMNNFNVQLFTRSPFHGSRVDICEVCFVWGH